MGAEAQIALMITGTQYPPQSEAADSERQPEPAVTIQEVSASCFRKGEAWYLFYEEQPEGYPEPLRTRVKCKGKTVEINRQGPLGHIMNFQEGKTYRTEYATPYGTLLLDIETESVECVENGEDLDKIYIGYALHQQGQTLGRYELSIEKRQKNGDIT